MLKKYSFLLNKYLLSALFFAILILCFDDSNLLTVQKDRLQELQNLEEKEQYYKNEIEKAQKEIISTNSGDEALEKYAREKYFMKKSNEDIFIIEDKK